MIDAFLMMYQTDWVDCVAQSEQKKRFENEKAAYGKNRAPKFYLYGKSK